MSMIVVYKKIPVEDIRKDTVETIVKVEAWFKRNPKRRVCHVEVWYGKRMDIHKGHVKEDMAKAQAEAISG